MGAVPPLISTRAVPSQAEKQLTLNPLWSDRVILEIETVDGFVISYEKTSESHPISSFNTNS
jgi:hypothetical protein